MMVQQCFLLLPSSKKTILNFSLDSLFEQNNICNGTSKNIKFIE